MMIEKNYGIEDLEKLEQLRWNAFLSIRRLHKGDWLRVFKLISTYKNVYGYDKSGNKILIKCHDGCSYHTEKVNEGSSSFEDYAKCLDDDQLALKVKSDIPELSETVIGIIGGSIKSYTRDDALIQEFIKLENMFNRRYSIRSYIDRIILYHFEAILNHESRKVLNSFTFRSTCRLSLTINGREYLYKDGEIIRTPDQDYIFYTIDRYIKEAIQ